MKIFLSKFMSKISINFDQGYRIKYFSINWPLKDVILLEQNCFSDIFYCLLLFQNFFISFVTFLQFKINSNFFWLINLYFKTIFTFFLLFWWCNCLPLWEQPLKDLYELILVTIISLWVFYSLFQVWSILI